MGCIGQFLCFYTFLLTNLSKIERNWPIKSLMYTILKICLFFSTFQLCGYNHKHTLNFMYIPYKISVRCLCPQYLGELLYNRFLFDIFLPFHMPFLGHIFNLKLDRFELVSKQDKGKKEKKKKSMVRFRSADLAYPNSHGNQLLPEHVKFWLNKFSSFNSNVITLSK